MLVTIFADASWCPDTGAAGYGVWCKSDRGTFHKGGSFQDLYRSSGEAEAAALVNAVFFAQREGILIPADRVLLQSDSLHALGILRGAIPQRTRNEQEAFTRLHEWRKRYLLDIEYRHVKGHNADGSRRSWVNQLCDDLAGKAMRSRRGQLRKAQHNGSPVKGT